MSEAKQINVRTTRAFRSRYHDLVSELYKLGLRENNSLSAYIVEAMREKRERDLTALDRLKVSDNS